MCVNVLRFRQRRFRPNCEVAEGLRDQFELCTSRRRSTPAPHPAQPQRTRSAAAAEAATFAAKGLATTSAIESPQSGVARGTATVTRWRDREIVKRALATILRRQPSAIAGEDSVK
jgi:hypothetical protein